MPSVLTMSSFAAVVMARAPCSKIPTQRNENFVSRAWLERAQTTRQRGFLIRRSQFLHERDKLVVILQHQRDVFLKLNGFCNPERRRELRQALFLVRLRYGPVGLKRGDLILDQLGWLGELFGLRVD